MFKRGKKVGSLLLVVVLALSLVVPAFAANGQVNITFADGSSTTLINTSDITLHEIGASDVDTVKVSDGSITDTYSEFKKAIEKTLTGGTRYQIYMQTSSAGARELHFRLMNTLNDNISIVVTQKDVQYTVNANSGGYGQNNNQGGFATCTSDVSAVTKVGGGRPYSVTYTPKPGQEITKVNLRIDAADGQGQIVDAKNGQVTVGGQTFRVSTQDNGKVTVSTTSTVRNIYITALTADEKPRYSLDVFTDRNCSADVTHEMLADGTSKNVTIKPTSGYVVSDITITDGAQSGKIAQSSTSLTLNGRTYTVTRKLDGSAVVSVPAIRDNVTVSAVAASDIHYIFVEESRTVESNKAGLNWLKDGQSFEFYYMPDSDVELRTVTVKSPSLGEKTFYMNQSGTVHGNGDDFYYNNGNWFDSNYWDNIYHGNIRMYLDSDGDLRIRVENNFENISFSVNGKEYVHDVDITTSYGIETEHDSYTVNDGDDLDVTFVPTKTPYRIVSLRVNYGGTVYTADVEDDSYIRVDGNRWYLSKGANGSVTLKMVDITEDVDIRVSSNSSTLDNMRITKSEDSHSNISYTGSNPFDHDEDTTIRAYADNNYVLDKVTFKVNNKTATVEPFDRTFSLAGYTYNVEWVDSSEFHVYFPFLPGNLTVTSKSVKGTPENVPGYNPSVPDGYHAAYLIGYGNGYFGPSDVLSRAQAVVMLNRAILTISDSTLSQYNYGTYFNDVQPGKWYTSAVNYAASCGYLSVLSSSGGYFRPDSPITRAEYLALLCNYMGVRVPHTSGSNNYTDVPVNHWAVDYINYATSQGWANGTGGGMFNPDRAVSRAEICVMTNRILGRSADPNVVVAAGPIFADVPMSYWAYRDIFEASNGHYASYVNGVEVWSR